MQLFPPSPNKFFKFVWLLSSLCSSLNCAMEEEAKGSISWDLGPKPVVIDGPFPTDYF